MDGGEGRVGGWRAGWLRTERQALAILRLVVLASLVGDALTVAVGVHSWVNKQNNAIRVPCQYPGRNPPNRGKEGRAAETLEPEIRRLKRPAGVLGTDEIRGFRGKWPKCNEAGFTPQSP